MVCPIAHVLPACLTGKSCQLGEVLIYMTSMAFPSMELATAPDQPGQGRFDSLRCPSTHGTGFLPAEGPLMADAALLERLTLASPRDLIAQTPAAGSLTLGSLYDQCSAAGLTAQPAESDVHRLHALCADGLAPRARVKLCWLTQMWRTHRVAPVLCRDRAPPSSRPLQRDVHIPRSRAS